MGNPHPSKSKPCKIGRKHTGAPSTRKKVEASKKRVVARQIRDGKHDKYKDAVAAYWRGEIVQFPEKPNYEER